MDPNYAAYLESIFPGTEWEAVAGVQGSTNATLRATKRSGDAGPRSLILKHAKPYFEDEGTKQEFTIKRQVNIPGLKCKKGQSQGRVG